ncbi:MAG: hypothetical protein K6L73_08885 [Cellvibrionaceae bacterium]
MKQWPIFIIVSVFSSSVFSGSYSFYNPTKIVATGQFYEDSGNWKLTATSSTAGRYDGTLKEINIHIDGKNLAIPEGIIGLKAPRISEITFRYINASNIKDFLSSNKNDRTDFIGLF